MRRSTLIALAPGGSLLAAPAVFAAGGEAQHTQSELRGKLLTSAAGRASFRRPFYRAHRTLAFTNFHVPYNRIGIGPVVRAPDAVRHSLAERPNVPNIRAKSPKRRCLGRFLARNYGVKSGGKQVLTLQLVL
jgi:hypothetical protein